jgi:hypothetical protein
LIGSSWVQRSVDLVGAASYRAGSSCALSSDGTTVAVGAPNFNGGLVNQGRVQVYGLDSRSISSYGGSKFIGINNPNPAYTLDVSGNVNATSYNAVSDYRIKENVTPLDLTFNVDVLKPVSYNLKGNDSHLHVGFIAHEVQEFFPFLVNGVKDGPETQSVNYNGFIGILTKEIQMLKKKDEENRAKLDAQESRMVAQESRIQCLEELVANLTKP